MTLQKHDLLSEFPDSRDSIHTLKMNNAHFAKLFEQYHNTDHDEIGRASCRERV